MLKRRPETTGSFQAEDLLNQNVKDWRDSIEFYSSTHQNAKDYSWYARPYDLGQHIKETQSLPGRIQKQKLEREYKNEYIQ